MRELRLSGDDLPQVQCPQGEEVGLGPAGSQNLTCNHRTLWPAHGTHGVKTLREGVTDGVSCFQEPK